MIQKIEEVMQEAVSQGSGLMGLGFCDLKSGETVFVNGDRLFPTASVYKIFILCELALWEKEGRLDLEKKIVLLDKDKIGGSGTLRNEPEGTEHTMKEYVDLMMQISDNTATDYLVRMVGKEAIYRDVIYPLGLEKTSIDLACEGLLKKYYANPSGRFPDPKSGKERGNYRLGSYFTCEEKRNNVSTPREMVHVMRSLYEGKVIDPETDRKILDEMAT